MMYRNDPKTSTSDWIRLNFSEVHGPAIAALCGDDFEALERVGRPEDFDMEEPEKPVEPEMPDIDAEMSAVEAFAINNTMVPIMIAYDKEMVVYRAELAAYEKAKEEYEEAVREFEEELNGFPVAWNCMWTPYEGKLRPDQTSALLEAGFIIYEVSAHTDVDFGFDAVFGVDGGGYDFYSDHWRPLRALVSRYAAQFWLSRDHATVEGSAQTIREHNELVDFLAQEERGGRESERFIKSYSLPVPPSTNPLVEGL